MAHAIRSSLSTSRAFGLAAWLRGDNQHCLCIDGRRSVHANILRREDDFDPPTSSPFSLSKALYAAAQKSAIVDVSLCEAVHPSTKKPRSTNTINRLEVVSRRSYSELGTWLSGQLRILGPHRYLFQAILNDGGDPSLLRRSYPSSMVFQKLFVLLQRTQAKGLQSRESDRMCPKGCCLFAVS